MLFELIILAVAIILISLGLLACIKLVLGCKSLLTLIIYTTIVIALSVFFTLIIFVNSTDLESCILIFIIWLFAFDIIFIVGKNFNISITINNTVYYINSRNLYVDALISGLYILLIIILVIHPSITLIIGLLLVSLALYLDLLIPKQTD